MLARRAPLLALLLAVPCAAFRLALNRSGANASANESVNESAVAGGGGAELERVEQEERVSALFNATFGDAIALQPHNMVQGPSAGGGGGGAFDHYNHQGYAGGIAEICVRSGRRLDNIEVSYAGTLVARGGRGGGRHCFPLHRGEVIVRVAVRAGARVDQIRFTTNTGRTSPEFGGGGGSLHTWSAPAGMHLMGFYGRSGAEVDRIGVWWGGGGGTAQWEAVQNCHGCSPFQYNIRVCSERRGSDSRETTERWSIGTQTEISSGFTFLGHGGRASMRISSEFSRQTVTRTERGFSETRCVETSFQCARQYLWQWTYRSAFDGQGVAATLSPAMVCTNDPNPCCLPGTFSAGGSPSRCDLNPRAPNTCR